MVPPERPGAGEDGGELVVAVEVGGMGIPVGVGVAVTDDGI